MPPKIVSHFGYFFRMSYVNHLAFLRKWGLLTHCIGIGRVPDESIYSIASIIKSKLLKSFRENQLRKILVCFHEPWIIKPPSVQMLMYILIHYHVIALLFLTWFGCDWSCVQDLLRSRCWPASSTLLFKSGGHLKVSNSKRYFKKKKEKKS